MPTSIFEIFKIGLGPSIVSTKGPMIAARRFVDRLKRKDLLEGSCRVRVDLHGPFARNGEGASTSKAVMLGLQGADPETIDLESIDRTLANIRKTGRLRIWNRESIVFDPHRDLVYHPETSPPFPLELHFTAYGECGLALLRATYSLTRDGSILGDDDCGKHAVASSGRMPYPFSSTRELETMCRVEDLAIWQLVLRNERSLSNESEVGYHLDRIWSKMRASVDRGMSTTGALPGELGTRRRAPGLRASLRTKETCRNPEEDSHRLEWLSVFATAVSEENAAGGRIVMAPTAGAAGVLAAVGMYYERFHRISDPKGMIRFLLTAGALGILFREHLVPGDEIGCQSEIGVAASMAAGALVAACGGANTQVIAAAEIALDRNLRGSHPVSQHLVQMPSLERNAIGAIHALEAWRQATYRSNRPNGESVSLDQLIRAMFRIGAQPSSEETDIRVPTA